MTARGCLSSAQTDNSSSAPLSGLQCQQLQPVATFYHEGTLSAHQKKDLGLRTTLVKLHVNAGEYEVCLLDV